MGPRAKKATSPAAEGGAKRKAGQAFGKPDLQLTLQPQQAPAAKAAKPAAVAAAAPGGRKGPQPLFPPRAAADGEQTLDSVKTRAQEQLGRLEGLLESGSVAEAGMRRAGDAITALATEHMRCVNESLQQSVAVMQQVKDNHMEALGCVAEAQVACGRKGEQLCREVQELLGRARGAALDEVRNIQRKSVAA